MNNQSPANFLQGTFLRLLVWQIFIIVSAVLILITGARPALSDSHDIPRLEDDRIVELEDPRERPYFHKTGVADCDRVVYTYVFHLPVPDGEDEFDNPYFMNFADQLPEGLSFSSAVISGDVDGPVPVPQISTTTNPNDTLTIGTFKFSNTDIDGDPSSRRIVITAVAQIDAASFPVPRVVSNQAILEIGSTDPRFPELVELPSHDPAIPDDGDIRTGEPTRTMIDLTDCHPDDGGDPGGDPGYEPCLILEIGELDCDPAAPGDFIYHMPVSLEMENTWVELVSLTPGVLVLPDRQFVAPGTVELVWTITGAAPGMTIQLLTNQIVSNGDGVDGFDLCCTVEIEIFIPRDIDCPPPEYPDLDIEKESKSPYCRPDGECDFVITVTNNGDAPYSGEIVVEDWILDATPVDLTFNPPWTCGENPASPGHFICVLPERTLNPGDSVSLVVTVKPGIEWQYERIRNCAKIYWRGDVIGLGTNDRDCAEIPIDQPEEPGDEPDGGPDLGVKKEVKNGVCIPGDYCTFIITITNHGTAPHTGPIVLEDIPAPAVGELVEVNPVGWNCVLSGAKYVCTWPDATIAPDGTFGLLLTLRFEDSGAISNFQRMQNCAVLIWPDGLIGDPGNDRSCIIIPIDRPDQPIDEPTDEPTDDPVQPLDKTGPKTCIPGEPCKFTVTITNVTATEIDGIFTLSDDFGGTYPGEMPILSIAPPLGCAPEPTSAPFSCQAKIKLAPGESQSHEIVVEVPLAPPAITAASGLRRNCFTISPAQGGSKDENQTRIPRERLGFTRDCHEFVITPPPPEEPTEPRSGIGIEKTCTSDVFTHGLVQCRVTLTNTGQTTHSGFVSFGDAANATAALGHPEFQSFTPDGDDWICQPPPPAGDVAACRIPGASLPPGTSRYVDMLLKLDVGLKNGTYRNCATVEGTDGQITACAEGRRVINIEKTGPVICIEGELCSFDISITNSGQTNSSHSVNLIDEIKTASGGDAGFEIQSIEPSLECAGGAPSAIPFTCAQNLILNAGETRNYRITIRVPRQEKGIRGSEQYINCFGAFDLNEPRDSVAGGRDLAIPRQETGCHQFTVGQEPEAQTLPPPRPTIRPPQTTVPPPTPQCTGGRVWNGQACVCRQGLRWNGRQCAKPAPRCNPPRVLNQAGNACVCPRGLRWNGRQCAKPAPRCNPPRVLNQAGNACVCQRGLRWVRGKCITVQSSPPPVTKPNCTNGRVWNGQRCSCPRSQRWNGKQCAKTNLQTKPNLRQAPTQRTTPNLRVNPNIQLCPPGQRFDRSRRRCVQ